MHRSSVIAIDATLAPLHYVNSRGDPNGFDVELVRAVVIDAGFMPEVIVLPCDKLFSGLLNRSHDLVVATTGITAERQETCRFSSPYFEICQVAVMRKGISEPEAIIDLVGLKIGASGQGISARAMSSIAGVHISMTKGEAPTCFYLDR
jgi:ABC-type amino acid transport substrate-binding protein